MELVSHHPPPLPCPSLSAVNVDEVDELIKSIAAGAETETDIEIQRACSKRESHKERGEQMDRVGKGERQERREMNDSSVRLLYLTEP